MRIFTKLGITFLLAVFATGMLWAQQSEAEIAAKMRNADLPDAYSKQVIGGGDIDADVIAIGKPMSMEKIKNLNIPSQTCNSDGTDVTEIIGSLENSWSAAIRTRGNAFLCTQPDKTLVEFMGWHEVDYTPTIMWMLVYEGDAAEGVYDLVRSVDITPAPLGAGWCSSGVINLPLEEGKYYLLLSSFQQECSYHNQQNVAPFPYPVAFGEAIGGAGWDWLPIVSFPPPETQTVEPGAWASPVLYYQQIVTEGGASYENDLGVQAISSPNSGGDLGSEEPVTVIVKNFGTSAQSGFDVSYSLDGGAAVVENISATLNSGEFLEYTFATTVDLSAFGVYELEAWTDLPGDENPDNDLTAKTIEHAYCNATTTNSDEYISNVLCGSINNASAWQGAVANFTDISTIIEAGSSEEITVSNGQPYSTDNVTAWVDWNSDYEYGIGGDEEFVLTNDGTGTVFTGTIAVPAGTPDGDHRMRVRMVYDEVPAPCGFAAYGEIEEYTITVFGGAAPDCENFDALIVGGYVAEQLGAPWTTWSGAPGGSEDAIVSDDFSMSPGNSFVINDAGIDLVRELAEEPIETGAWLYSNYIYVPTGFSGYFNIQSEPTVNVDWVIELYFDDGGTGSFAGEGIGTFEYAQDTWILVEINFDLDSDIAQVFFDGNMVFQFANTFTIGSVDYWGSDSGGAPGAYYDDVCFVEGWPLTVGIEDIEACNDVQVYPNPATDVLYIETTTGLEEVQLFSLTGQLIFTHATTDKKLQINTSSFESGIYFVKVFSKDQIITKKLVIE